MSKSSIKLILKIKDKMSKKLERKVLKIKLNIEVSFELDFKFWAIIPNVNLNFRSFIIEFEFLCFAMYLNFSK